MRTARAAAVAVAVVTAGALAAPAAVAATAAPAPRPHRATQEAIDQAVRDGVPGAVAQARDAHGSWKGTSGVGNTGTKAPRGTGDHFRIGSITKVFTATVVLQLEAEGKLDVDDTVEKWLPGVVRGHGHDGRKVTIRQLLNHTSGIFNATEDDEFVQKYMTTGFLKHRYDTWTPERVVGLAMRHAPDFAPGKGWHYSNTNYVLAGMIIEKATGHPYADEVRKRIVEPLRLRDTSLPGATETRLPQPASRAYTKLPKDPRHTTYDATEMNVSWAGPAGEIVSGTNDLNRFVSALLGGKVLPKKQLKEMRTTVGTHGQDPGARYGLGLIRTELSCGRAVWGHDGGLHGSTSDMVATEDGRHSLAFNFNGDWAGDHGKVLDAEFCPR